MLFNVPEINISLPSGESLPEATSVSRENITVPSSSSNPNVIKASYSRSSGHYEGIILNNSGNTSSASAIYVLFVNEGSTPPSHNTVIQEGIIIAAYGGFIEIPKKSQVDVYLATPSGINAYAKGLYFTR